MITRKVYFEPNYETHVTGDIPNRAEAEEAVKLN